MKKEIISNKQGISIMHLFLIGSTIVTGGASKAKQDTWISILVAVAMALPIMFIYARLLKLFPGKDLFDIVNEVLGKFLGKIVSLIFIWYFLTLGASVIRRITEFIQITSMTDTPQFFIALFLGMVSIYMVKSGIEVLGRWSEFIIPIVIFAIVFTSLLLVPKMNFANIKPVLYSGFKPVFQGAFALFTLPFAETIILTVIFSSLERPNKSFKTYSFGLLITAIVMIIAAIRNILVLGVASTDIHYFISYYAVSVTDIGNFLQRIESTIATIVILSGIAKLSVCLLATGIGISKFFNINDYRPLTAPTCLLMIALSFIIFRNTVEMFEWTSEYYPLYSIPCQIILPLILWITAEKKKSSKANIGK